MYYIKWIRKSDGVSEYLVDHVAREWTRKEFSSPADALEYIWKNILTTETWGLDYFDYILEQQTLVTVGRLESKTIVDWV